MGFLAAALGLCFARGPREKGWLGWSGGWSLKRDGDSGSGEGKGGHGEEKKTVATGDSGLSLGEKGKGQDSGEKETEINAEVDLEKVEKDRFAGMGNR